MPATKKYENCETLRYAKTATGAAFKAFFRVREMPFCLCRKEACLRAKKHLTEAGPLQPASYPSVE
jgi:hypothetical protein